MITRLRTALAVSAIAAAAAGTFPLDVANAVPSGLSISDISWGVIGLDSNDVTAGPDTFEHGARVCNTTGSTQEVTVDWAWLSANAFVSLAGPSSIDRTIVDGACTDVYFNVKVARDSAAYDTARGYQIAATDGTNTVSTPDKRELYVEHLVSQARNKVTGVAGPTGGYIGETVTFTLDAYTATQGYGQLVAYLTADSNVLDITSVSATYASPAGATNDRFYANACGWDPDTLSASYRSCVGPNQYTAGKVGGNPINVTVTATVVGAGSSTIAGVVYDFSGSSFHYNGDFGNQFITFTAAPPTVTAVADTAATTENTPVDIGVLDNDTPAGTEFDSASVNVTDGPANGAVEIDPSTGTITYTPNDGFTGEDSFSYEVCDTSGLYCDTAATTITVDPAPTIAAVDDEVTTDYMTPVDVDVLANDDATGTELDPASVNVTDGPANGAVEIDPFTGTITYTPGEGFYGVDTFLYEVCDSTYGMCTSATVSAAVEGVPAVSDDTAQTEPGKPVVINVLDNDTMGGVDLDASSVTVVEVPANGVASVDSATGKITYTPNAGFYGTDRFTYSVCDGTGVCFQAEVVVSVLGIPTPKGVLPYSGSSTDDFMKLALLLLVTGVLAQTAARRRRTT